MTSRESRNAADERRRYRGNEREDERRRRQSRQYKTSVDRDHIDRLGAMQSKAAAAAAERVPPEPLRLPRGSVRALVTLLVACSCLWVFVGRQPVPGSLLELALATVAYYFALRRGGAKPPVAPYADGGSAQYSRTSSAGTGRAHMRCQRVSCTTGCAQGRPSGGGAGMSMSRAR